MQLNKILKGMAVALPLFTLAACSSTDTDNATVSDTNKEEIVDVVVNEETVVETLTPEEIMNNELRQSQTVYFNFDDTTINSQFDDMLGAHAEFLIANSDIAVAIEGHADERGTPEYNIALGEHRANAVAKYLEALGVPAKQISVVSFGEEKPLMFGHNDEAYELNRRAVLVY